jgi:PKD domain
MIRRIGPATLATALALASLMLALAVPATAAPGFVTDETLAPTAIDAPMLAMAPNGYTIIVWAEAPAADVLLRVSTRPPGGPWSSPQTLDASGDWKYDLHVAVNSAGDAAVTWSELPVAGPTVYVATRPAGGSFGAAEPLGARTLSPAVGVDGSGRVTLIHTARPAVVARDFQVGGSALAAPARTLEAAGCDGGAARLALAPSGDALAGYYCGGAAFALRRGGAWTSSPPIADVPDPGCSSSTSYMAASVAIDAAGHSIGVLRTDTASNSIGMSGCTQQSITSDATLVLPVAGSMTPVGGPPAATGSGIIDSGMSAPQAAVSPAGIVFAWGDAQSPGRAIVKARDFALDGSGGSAPQTVSTTPSLGFLEPSLGVAADGRALLAWLQQDRPGADVTVLAADRAPGGTFGLPVPLSSGPDVLSSAAVASSDAGDGVVAWEQGASPYAVHARGYDASPPLLSGVAIPASAAVAAPAAFAASPFDVWGPATLSWAFGDGGTATGAAPTHVYARAGTFIATVTATDAVGNAASRSGTVQVAAAGGGGAAAPALSGTSLTNRRFRVGRARTAVSARRRASRAPVGTTFRFRLDKGASLAIALSRQASGLRFGRRCVRPSRGLRGHRRCTRLVVVRPALTRSLPAGANAVPFSGRIGRRALVPGSYMATLTATAAGRAGTPSRLGFRVMR